MFSSTYLKVQLYQNANGDDEARLLEDFSFLTKDGVLITAKKGFCFDGASVPRFFWRIIGHPLSTKYIRSACIHDLLYATEVFDREKSDLIFEDALTHDNVSDWKIQPMYGAVRIGGGSAWKNHTAESIHKNLNYIEMETIA